MITALSTLYQGQDQKTVETLDKQQLDIEALKENMKALIFSESKKVEKGKAAADEQQCEINVLQEKVNTLKVTSTEIQEQSSKLAIIVEQLQKSSSSKKTASAVGEQQHTIEVLQKKVLALQISLAETQEESTRVANDVDWLKLSDHEATSITNNAIRQMVLAHGSHLQAQQTTMKEMETKLADVEAQCRELEVELQMSELYNQGLDWQDPRLQQLVRDVAEVTSQSEGITQMVMLPNSWIHKRHWDDLRLLKMEEKMEQLLDDSGY